MTAGQTGIRLRTALASGDTATAARCVPALDAPHRIELLLGAAIRDARGAWAAAHAWMAAEAGRGDWARVCALLAEGEPDDAFDRIASAWVAAGRVPETWRGSGLPLAGPLGGAEPDVAVARAYAAGVSGDALVDAFAEHPLHAAVRHYYRRGTIHALGPRPLLILALAAGSR